jgi:hypothetical protein
MSLPTSDQNSEATPLARGRYTYAGQSEPCIVWAFDQDGDPVITTDDGQLRSVARHRVRLDVGQLIRRRTSA